ncbi:MAG: hypothetical protein V8S11_11775 [Flavonifractor plautii]
MTNAAHLAIALAIITFVAKSPASSGMNAAGLKAGIIFYSVVVILLGILVLLFLRILRPTTSPSDSTSSRCSP